MATEFNPSLAFRKQISEPYRRGHWRMIDYARFVEVFSPLAFFDLNWGRTPDYVKRSFEKQWAALREAIMCIIRPPSSNLQEVVASYAAAISTYVDEVEKVTDHNIL